MTAETVTISEEQLRFLSNMAKASTKLGYATTQVENAHLIEIIRLARKGLRLQDDVSPPQQLEKP